MSHWETAGATDDWYTPRHVFEALGCTFDMDIAAPKEGPRHVPALRWYSENSLSAPWEGFIWMNPPFGGRNALVPWMNKFFEHGNGIALTPDRTSAPWWQDSAQKADMLLFTRGKIKFERPDGTIGPSPGSGVTLWAAGQTAINAIIRADGAGLGIACAPFWGHE